MKKLAIIVTHPIQYYVPVFRELAKYCELKVYYTWGEKGLLKKYDPGFQRDIEWDLPLLKGYDYELLVNTSKAPGSHHSKGIINPDIITRISAFQPDAILIYGHMYKSHFKVMRFFKKKVPIWFRGDSHTLNNPGGLKALIKWAYLRWVYNYVDKAFYVGSNNKSYFERYGLKAEQLVFAPHSVDNYRFGKNRDEEVEVLKRKLGIKKTDTTFLYAGKFESIKNISLLIDCFKRLDAPNIKLLLVGNGPEELFLKETARSNSNIIFMDFKNQSYLPVIYQTCDIFCLPSSSETWGLAVNEAMAAGKAILVSDKVGCAIDLVRDSVNGVIFEAGNIDDLFLKITKLLKCDLYVYGQKSLKLIQNWSFQAQVSQLINNLNA
jgi:glycosyltransferase involved in cell wall biosynthesis